MRASWCVGERVGVRERAGVLASELVCEIEIECECELGRSQESERGGRVVMMLPSQPPRHELAKAESNKSNRRRRSPCAPGQANQAESSR